MTGAVLSMRQTAALVGLSYDRFRKVWPDLQGLGFPAPFIGVKWDQAAVEAWKAARTNRVAALPVAPATRPDLDAGRRARRQLAALRAGG